MEEKRNTQEKVNQVTKTGVIPDQQLDGSDADKAYDANGKFSEHQESRNEEDKISGTQEASDADTDQR